MKMVIKFKRTIIGLILGTTAFFMIIKIPFVGWFLGKTLGTVLLMFLVILGLIKDLLKIIKEGV